MMVAIGLGVTFTDLLSVARANSFVNEENVERQDTNAPVQMSADNDGWRKTRGPSALAEWDLTSLNGNGYGSRGL